MSRSFRFLASLTGAIAITVTIQFACSSQALAQLLTGPSSSTNELKEEKETSREQRDEASREESSAKASKRKKKVETGEPEVERQKAANRGKATGDEVVIDADKLDSERAAEAGKQASGKHKHDGAHIKKQLEKVVEKHKDRTDKKPFKPSAVVRAKSDKSPAARSRGIAPCLAWVDRTKPILAVLVCVHGLGLHNGTYEPFGKRMSEAGFATYAIDVRGFGAWMAAEGRERVDFEHCLNDVATTLKVVRRAHPNVPVFLLGESMGGAIALRVTALYPDLVDGLISSVPAGDRFKQAKTSLKVAFGLFGSPNKPINVGHGVVMQATQDPALRKQWLEDPLTKNNLTPRELMQFQKFMNGNHDCAKSISKTPVLIVQGCKDKLVRPEGTVELFNHLATHDREIVLIPNAEHLIFEEGQFTDQEIATVTEWMGSRLKKEDPTEEK